MEDIKAELQLVSSSVPPECQEIEQELQEIQREAQRVFERSWAENTPLLSAELNRLREHREALENELKRLESSQQTPFDPERAAQEICSFIGDFDRVLKKAMPQELKGFLRAFVASVKVYGRERTAEVGFFRFPVTDPGKSWDCMVAGARYAPEKKTPARILDFDFERERIRIGAETPAELSVTCLAA